MWKLSLICWLTTNRRRKRQFIHTTVQTLIGFLVQRFGAFDGTAADWHPKAGPPFRTANSDGSLRAADNNSCQISAVSSLRNRKMWPVSQQLNQVIFTAVSQKSRRGWNQRHPINAFISADGVQPQSMEPMEHSQLSKQRSSSDHSLLLGVSQILHLAPGTDCCDKRTDHWPIRRLPMTINQVPSENELDMFLCNMQCIECEWYVMGDYTIGFKQMQLCSCLVTQERQQGYS